MTIAQKRILIAEDDASFRETLAMEFQERDYDVTAIACLNDFDSLLRQQFDLAVVDLKLGTDSGLELIEKLHRISPNTTSVVLTGYSSIATAVKAIRDVTKLNYPNQHDNTLCSLYRRYPPWN